MNFPFYIAKRYLFSKKSHNAINVISAISVCGVALATLALVCTLSVFNGFQDLVATFFTAFDPELKITATTGKVFDGQDERIEALRQLPEVAVFSESLEENAMVQYKDRQTMAVIKGIEDNFEDLTAIDSILFGRGQFVLHDEVADYAISGIELVSILGTGIKFLDPLQIYAPKRGAKVNMANPASSFTFANLHSTGLVFAVNQQKYDSSYILTSLQFARRLFQYDTEVSSVELKLKSVAAVMFVGCSTDGYWDKAPIDSEVKYTFDQSEQTYSVAGTETLTEIKVSLTRNTNVGASTIAVDAKFNDPALSGPAEVTFADGSNTAIYTIAVGDIQVGVSYKATLSIAKDNTSVSGNSTTTINLSKLYNWVAAGSAQFYTSWSGTIDDNGLVGDGVKVDIEKAEGGNGLYRLVSPYYYSETAAGATGVTLEKGHHIQFTVNAANGAPVGFPTTVQKMGEASADDGNY